MQGYHPEGKSSLVVEAEGWRSGAVPVESEEQGVGEQVPAPSPASAEGWAYCPESTGPGSGGKCLRDRDSFDETSVEGDESINESVTDL